MSAPIAVAGPRASAGPHTGAGPHTEAAEAASHTPPTPPTPLTPHRAERIGAVLEAVVSLSRSLTSRRSTPFGDTVLTRSQVEVLFLLARAKGPVTPGELASTLRLTRGAITQVVDQLCDAGLVQRSTPARDGRARVLALTDSARAQVETFEAAAVRRAEPWFAALSDDDLATLATLIAEVETT